MVLEVVSVQVDGDELVVPDDDHALELDSVELVRVSLEEDSLEGEGAAWELVDWKNCTPLSALDVEEDEEEEEDEDDGDDELGEPPLLLSPPALYTTKLAVDPFATVTTQKAPPPAPLLALPSIWLTRFWLGSIAQGRPLHPPSGQSIFTPQVGI